MTKKTEPSPRPAMIVANDAEIPDAESPAVENAATEDDVILRKHFGAQLTRELFALLRQEHQRWYAASKDLAAALAEQEEALFEQGALLRYRPPTIEEARKLGEAIRESERRIARARNRIGAAERAWMRAAWIVQYAPDLGLAMPDRVANYVASGSFPPESVQNWFELHPQLKMQEWMEPGGWKLLAKQPEQKRRAVLRTVVHAPVNQRRVIP